MCLVYITCVYVNMSYSGILITVSAIYMYGIVSLPRNVCEAQSKPNPIMYVCCVCIYCMYSVLSMDVRKAHYCMTSDLPCDNALEPTVYKEIWPVYYVLLQL